MGGRFQTNLGFNQLEFQPTWAFPDARSDDVSARKRLYDSGIQRLRGSVCFILAGHERMIISAQECALECLSKIHSSVKIKGKVCTAGKSVKC